MVIRYVFCCSTDWVKNSLDLEAVEHNYMTLDNLNFQGKKGSSHCEFKILRVKLSRKWPEGKNRLL